MRIAGINVSVFRIGVLNLITDERGLNRLHLIICSYES